MLIFDGIITTILFLATLGEKNKDDKRIYAALFILSFVVTMIAAR